MRENIVDKCRTGLKHSKFILPSALLLALIYLADFQKLIASFYKSNLVFFIASIGLGIATMGVFAFTWYRLLNKTGIKVNYWKSLKLFYAGQFLNSVTPLGQFGGEPAMAYIIKKHRDTKYHEAFCIVLSADIINAVPAFTFILGGGAYLLLFSSMPDSLNYMIATGVAIALLGAALTYIIWYKTRVIESAVSSILRKINSITGLGSNLEKKFREKMDEIQETLSTVGENPSHLLKTALVAHLSFVFSFSALVLITHSVNASPDLTKLYFIITISGLAEFTPTPGGAGAYEATMTGLLTTLTGIPLSTAATISILYRLATYWPDIALGYLSLMKLQAE